MQAIDEASNFCLCNELQRRKIPQDVALDEDLREPIDALEIFDVS